MTALTDHASLPWAVVTGSNRGIGLELVTALCAGGRHRVAACCRSPDLADELHRLGESNPQLWVAELDVTDDRSIERFAQGLLDQEPAVSMLVNNAGIGLDEQHTILTMPLEDIRRQLETHAIGPLVLVRRLVDRMIPGAVIANVSSVVSGLSRPRSSYAGYAQAKALQNSFTVTLAATLDDRGIIVLALEPGWVATDMGGATAPTTPAASASGLLDQILGATPADSGTFRDYRGDPVAW